MTAPNILRDTTPTIGMVHPWTESGVHVATVTQTAMLRSFGPVPGSTGD